MFFCIALVYAIVSYAINVKDCAAGKGYFKVDHLSVSPANPIAGENITLNYGYTVPSGAYITDGVTKYAVTYNFIPLATTTEPLCKNVPCPVVGGSYTNQSTMVWPSGITGSISVKTTWEDVGKRMLMCTLISGNV
jgi:hypothetical protein